MISQTCPACGCPLSVILAVQSACVRRACRRYEPWVRDHMGELLRRDPALRERIVAWVAEQGAEQE